MNVGSRQNASWIGICLTFAVLIPFVMLVLQVPYYPLAFVVGAPVLFAGIYPSYRNIRFDTLYFVAVATVLLAMTFLMQVHPDQSIKWHRLILYLVYGSLAGIMLRMLITLFGDVPVLIGLCCVSILLGAAGFGVIRAVDVERYIRVDSGDVFRSNDELEEIVFWRVARIQNVVIGVVSYAALGASCLSCFFVARSKAISVLLAATILISLYSNIVFVTRSAFVAVGFASLTIFGLMFVRGGAERRVLMLRRAILLGFVSLTLVAIGMLLLPDRLEAFRYRFSSESGSNHGRIEVWREALDLILENPLGGSVGKLRSQEWAHNFILDIGLSSGWIGILAGVVLLGTLVRQVWLASRDDELLSSIASIHVLSFFFTCLAIAMIHPPQHWLYNAFFIIAGFFSFTPTSPEQSDDEL